jgi:hypothetical protein
MCRGLNLSFASTLRMALSLPLFAASKSEVSLFAFELASFAAKAVLTRTTVSAF